MYIKAINPGINNYLCINKNKTNMDKKKLLRFTMVAMLLTQVAHTASVFAMAGQETNNFSLVMSYVFALGLELSIYIFTVNNENRMAYTFALVSLIMNVLYFWKSDVVSVQFISGMFISAVTPAIICCYSELIKKEFQEKAIAESKHEEMMRIQADAEEIIRKKQLANAKQREKSREKRLAEQGKSKKSRKKQLSDQVVTPTGELA